MAKQAWNRIIMTKQSSKNIIALIYDFDGTLSPQPMQEYTVLPELGIKPGDFWSDVDKEVQRTGGEDIITYMRMMYERAEEKRAHIDHDKLKDMGRRVKYFKGVEDWFSRINAYIEKQSNGLIETRHYIISSGLKEILEGVSVYGEFHNVFASEYFFDHHGRASYPNRVITDTTKTQYLFRINKGVEDLTQSINSHMPIHDRPIPFENMIYYGDGLTDVPSMAVTRANGGHSIAVHTPRKSKRACQILFDENRCDVYAPADYSQNSDLHRRTLLILDKVIANILLQKELGTLG
jgi:phosphoserine phosphatase